MFYNMFELTMSLVNYGNCDFTLILFKFPNVIMSNSPKIEMAELRKGHS